MGNDNIKWQKSQSKNIPDKLVKEMNSQNVWINEHRWQQYKMKDITPFIKEWKTKVLVAQKNEYPDIIKQIQLISFPKVKQIVLTKNNIYTIEPLSRLNMPVLEMMKLYNNQIVSITPFAKTNFFSLQQIFIDDNFIQDFSSLAKMGSNPIKRINIEWISSDAEQGCDIRWIGKLRGEKLKELWISSGRRIKVDMGFVRRKYEGIEIQQ